MSVTPDRAAARRPEAPTPPAGAAPVRGPGAAPGVAEVDASMRLLREVMAHPVDPAYEMAVARRRAGGAEGAGRRAAVVTVVLALVCGWVVTRGVAELRRPEPGQAVGRAALEREITRRTDHADAQLRAIERLRREVAAAQRVQLTAPGDVELAQQAEQLGVVAGEVPVSGPGLQITLRDAPSTDPAVAVDAAQPSTSEDGRVLDRDVQIVVNGLWVAGAEAISVNGRRLTTLSAIRSAGQAILVDFRPLVPPYVISGVGDPATLSSRFTEDQAGSYLQTIRDNYGVGVDVATATRLTLPGAGTLGLHAAQPVTATTRSLSVPPTVSSTAPSPAPSTEVGP